MDSRAHFSRNSQGCPGLPRAGRLPAAAWHEDHNLSRQPRKACQCLLIITTWVGMNCGTAVDTDAKGKR